MTTRDTLKLKELIYSTLVADSALESLLGGSGKIRQAAPQQLSDYPLVVYTILVDVDNIYDIDQPNNVVQSSVVIECFSNNTASEQVDAIEDRVYEILNGVRLSTTDVQMYSAYRVNKAANYEPDVNVWHTVSTYNLYNSTL